jgi:hypothetical protein
LPYNSRARIQEDDLQDTGTSPVKDREMEIDQSVLSGELGAKRRLHMDGMLITGGSEEDYQKDTEDENLQDMSTDVIPDKLEEGKLALLTDRSKRTKKAGADSPSYESAGSREEPVREQ